MSQTPEHVPAPPSRPVPEFSPPPPPEEREPEYVELELSDEERRSALDRLGIRKRRGPAVDLPPRMDDPFDETALEVSPPSPPLTLPLAEETLEPPEALAPSSPAAPPVPAPPAGLWGKIEDGEVPVELGSPADWATVTPDEAAAGVRMQPTAVTPTTDESPAFASPEPPPAPTEAPSGPKPPEIVDATATESERSGRAWRREREPVGDVAEEKARAEKKAKEPKSTRASRRELRRQAAAGHKEGKEGSGRSLLGLLGIKKVEVVAEGAVAICPVHDVPLAAPLLFDENTGARYPAGTTHAVCVGFQAAAPVGYETAPAPSRSSRESKPSKQRSLLRLKRASRTKEVTEAAETTETTEAKAERKSWRERRQEAKAERKRAAESALLEGLVETEAVPVKEPSRLERLRMARGERRASALARRDEKAAKKAAKAAQKADARAAKEEEKQAKREAKEARERERALARQAAKEEKAAKKAGKRQEREAASAPVVAGEAPATEEPVGLKMNERAGLAGAEAPRALEAGAIEPAPYLPVASEARPTLVTTGAQEAGATRSLENLENLEGLESDEVVTKPKRRRSLLSFLGVKKVEEDGTGVSAEPEALSSRERRRLAREEKRAAKAAQKADARAAKEEEKQAKREAKEARERERALARQAAKEEKAAKKAEKNRGKDEGGEPAAAKAADEPRDAPLDGGLSMTQALPMAAPRGFSPPIVEPVSEEPPLLRFPPVVIDADDEPLPEAPHLRRPHLPPVTEPEGSEEPEADHWASHWESLRAAAAPADGAGRAEREESPLIVDASRPDEEIAREQEKIERKRGFMTRRERKESTHAEPAVATGYWRQRLLAPEARPFLLLLLAAFALLAFMWFAAVRADTASVAGLSVDSPADPSSSPPTPSASPTSPSGPSGGPAAPGETIEVPDLVGGSLEAARALLESRGLTAQVLPVQSDAPLNEVVAQEPAAGEDVAEGATVVVSVSAGEAEVPKVIGLATDKAVAAVEDAGFVVERREQVDLERAGKVLDQKPAAGAVADQGSVVVLFVAKKPEAAALPKVVGNGQVAARAALTDRGYKVNVRYKQDESEAGTVIATEPAQTEKVAPGQTVTIVVSLGQPSSSSNTVVAKNNGDVAYVVVSGGRGEIMFAKPNGKRPVNLTTHAADDRNPTFSPTGLQMAFQSNRAGNYDIYVRPLTSEAVKRLTTADADEREPAWSPDGRRIAYVVKEKGFYALYTMAQDGSGKKRVLGGQRNWRRPAWSRDGKSLAVAGGTTENLDVYVVSAQGGKPRLIASGSSWDTDPSFSPNGKRVVFASNRDGDYDLYSVSVQGGNLRRLTNAAGDDLYPSFSPNGKRILFASTRGGNTAVYHMPASGGKVARVAGGQAPSWQPVF